MSISLISSNAVYKNVPFQHWRAVAADMNTFRIPLQWHYVESTDG
jgi:hypothetical protein